ncbi:hypothetical protein AB0M28_30895 [Streptomyces sp. NPDC051940]|uniref:hypothetical protein n=1 Tax=Streptomyces sp. NPDC051940 TaxID=3155675 RepID=UPI00343CA5BB
MSQGDDYGDDFGSPYGERQTRTRLPEDGFGSRAPGRAGRRSGGAAAPSRGLVAVLGVVVLLIAVIAFVNRGGDDGGSSGGGGASDKGSTPTAPTGERPVQGRNGALPAGFPKTEQGAQSAAANYAVALVSAEILRSDDRHAIVDQLFVSAKVDDLQAKFDKTYSAAFLDRIGLDSNGQPTRGATYVSRTSPVGTKVVDFAEASATIDVWCTGVYGTAGVGSKNPVTNDWFTMTLKLRWENGDWKVETFTQKDGPAPVTGDQRASSADEMAKAVQEFGGFTYAR